MPRISERGKLIPESPIRKLVPFAEEAIKKGIKIYHLNIGQPDIESPELSLNAIKNFDKKIIEYSPSAGFESYRKKLAEYYKQHNIDVNYSDILITTGASEALLFAFKSILNPGDEIIIPEPFYANYLSFAISSDVNIVPVSSKIENGFALPSIKVFEKKITNKTKAILICNPVNPTGYLYSKKELYELQDIAKKYNLFLIADEVYREFVYDGKKHNTVMQLDIPEQIIMVDSASKRYSMCGIRIGALITKNKDVYNTALKFAQSRLSPPTLGQIAAESAIDTPVSYFENVIAEYQRRRDILVELLNNIPGVICPKPGGAFYTIAKLPIDDAENFCKWLLKDFSYHKQTVMLAPASGFYASKGLGKQEVRVAYVLNTSELKKAVLCLKAALQKYYSIKE